MAAVVAVAEDDAVDDDVELPVAVMVLVAVDVAVVVLVAVDVAVIVLVAVDVNVMVPVAVDVAVCVCVPVAAPVFVLVLVAEDVLVAVPVMLALIVALGVGPPTDAEKGGDTVVEELRDGHADAALIVAAGERVERMVAALAVEAGEPLVSCVIDCSSRDAVREGLTVEEGVGVGVEDGVKSMSVGVGEGVREGDGVRRMGVGEGEEVGEGDCAGGPRVGEGDGVSDRDGDRDGVRDFDDDRDRDGVEDTEGPMNGSATNARNLSLHVLSRGRSVKPPTTSVQLPGA